MQQIVQNQTSPTYVQFRDSKLTRVLQDSVGGNCKTVLITNISPSNRCFFETLNSLKFADRAKSIQQHAEINQIEDYQVRLQKYKLEIQRLNGLIAERMGDQASEADVQLKLELEKQYKQLE